jgi:hypothetical protein
MEDVTDMKTSLRCRSSNLAETGQTIPWDCQVLKLMTRLNQAGHSTLRIIPNLATEMLQDVDLPATNITAYRSTTRPQDHGWNCPRNNLSSTSGCCDVTSRLRRLRKVIDLTKHSIHYTTGRPTPGLRRSSSTTAQGTSCTIRDRRRYSKLAKSVLVIITITWARQLRRCIWSTAPRFGKLTFLRNMNTEYCRHSVCKTALMVPQYSDSLRQS